ncbi:fluoride efflux transporter CrcB [Salinicola halophilus]|uniref:fluoride efflux transporter CrcB n=1 Tax=Salinicola halophilus TaxID=184065 RepID=UPI000DA1E7DC|nr:fluoride efflux transporter CrcB [Salinicola halophilus]
MWISIVAISLGAAIGANLRWWLGAQYNGAFLHIPPGTLIANLVGAWLIGLALSFFQDSTLSVEWKLFAVTGLLGALTTFSTFSAEMVGAIQSGRWAWALTGTLVHVLGSFAMTALGIACYGWLRH